jgi:ABC-2 type transport system permease protein
MTVSTPSQSTRDLRLAARQGLLPVVGGSWMAGFGNMFAKEMGEWFRTRRWIWQLFIWLSLISGFVGIMLFVMPLLDPLFPGINEAMNKPYEGFPPGSMGLINYFTIAVMAGTIGAIILAHDEIIQEKQSGTVAWILSKPATRLAFILTKLLSNTIGTFIFIVAVPALVTLGEVFLDIHQMVPLLPFVKGVGVVMLGLFFYTSLMILLGVLYESRGPVMGIAFGLLLGGNVLSGFIPYLSYGLPVNIDKIAQIILLGMPLPTVFISQLISTAVLSILCILVALWRFKQKEF